MKRNRKGVIMTGNGKVTNNGLHPKEIKDDERDDMDFADYLLQKIAKDAETGKTKLPLLK